MHPDQYKRFTEGEPPRLLTIAEVCRLLSCSRSFLYSEIAAGRIHTVKLGQATRTSAAELARYVASLDGTSAGEAH